jgi:hypothetical protein
VTEETAMKCYECAKQGKDVDAVAMCVICGMGLCMDHAIRENLPVVDIIDWGFGKEEHRYPVDIPRFLCSLCKAAVDIRKKER